MKKILQKETNSNDQTPEPEVEEEATEKTGMINENIIKLVSKTRSSQRLNNDNLCMMLFV